jgi:hypothetical protein
MTPPTIKTGPIGDLYGMDKKQKIFERMRDTVESVHEHIEMEFSGEAFAVWIFGTSNKVTTMVTKPEKLAFAQDTVTAAVSSNPVIKELFTQGLVGEKNTYYENDELVFEKQPARREILAALNLEAKLMFKVIEQALNTKRVAPDAHGNVPMNVLTDYVLPKFQNQTGFLLSDSISLMADVLDLCGAETYEGDDDSNAEINFTNSVFKWRKN